MIQISIAIAAVGLFAGAWVVYPCLEGRWVFQFLRTGFWWIIWEHSCHRISYIIYVQISLPNECLRYATQISQEINHLHGEQRLISTKMREK